MPETLACTVTDTTQVAECRRAGGALAGEAGFDETRAGELAIIITELGTNLLKHAGGGELLLRRLDFASGDNVDGVEVISLDKGRGIPNLNEALKDGFSTAGSQGTGLGAVKRLAQSFDVYARPNEGTVIVAGMWKTAAGTLAPRTQAQVGVVNAPLKGQSVCGDSWALRQDGGLTRVLVIDGLGHGPVAAEAAGRGKEAFLSSTPRSAADMMSVLNDALRPTRGAAAAIGVVDHAGGLLRWCGVGNIAGVIIGGEGERHLVTHNGTLGQSNRKFSDIAYPWPPGGALVMTSDGIGTRWTMAPYPGLTRRHPSIVAAALYRDYARGRDDATVLVLTESTP